MTQNIDDILTSARVESWDIERSISALEELARGIGAGSRVDWDRGAGEQWGRVLRDSNVVGYVAMNGALVVIDSAQSPVISALENAGFRVLAVPSMTDQCLSATRERLEQWAGRAISHAINPDCFSMEELWWATI